MPTISKTYIDGIEITTTTTEISSANLLRASIGSNSPRGGDSGHGGRTVFVLEDRGGTDLRCSLNPNEPASRVQRIEIVLGGDTECETFIEALEFAAHNLRLLSTAQATNTRQDWLESFGGAASNTK